MSNERKWNKILIMNIVRGRRGCFAYVNGVVDVKII